MKEGEEGRAMKMGLMDMGEWVDCAFAQLHNVPHLARGIRCRSACLENDHGGWLGYSCDACAAVTAAVSADVATDLAAADDRQSVGSGSQASGAGPGGSEADASSAAGSDDDGGEEELVSDWR